MIHLADAFIQRDFTIEEYNKRYIIKRQTVTEMLVILISMHCLAKLARQGEVKEQEQRFFLFFMKKKEQKSSEDRRDEFSGVLKIVRDSAFRMGGGDHSSRQER